MAAFETIMFDDGGTVVELQTARSVRRAVENGVLTADTLVTLIALDGSTRRLRAFEIEALGPLFSSSVAVEAPPPSAAIDSDPAPPLEAVNDVASTQVAAVGAAVPITEAGIAPAPIWPPTRQAASSVKPAGCGLAAWGWTLLIGGFLLSAAFPPASLAFLIGLALLIFVAVRAVARRLTGSA